MKSFVSCPPLAASVAGAGFDLRDANKSREGAFKQLLLLEEHLSQDQCPECCNKHLFTAIAYLEEARRLSGGSDEDISMADLLRDAQPDLPHIDVRPLRKALAVKLGYAFDTSGPS